MRVPDATRFFVGGQWYHPESGQKRSVINPASEEAIGDITFGTASDVNRAVAAARAAFPAFARTSVAERRELLKAINAKLIERNDEIAWLISQEMGAPLSLARAAQAPSGPQHFGQVIKELESFAFTERLGTTAVRHEAIGVCALITPWNWPINQIATKVAPALAAGCTMVLKPSELAPYDAVILAEIMEAVGVPAGVFNLIHGDGEGVGAPLTSHKDVDMVSFTGSTRAGVAISIAAASTVKRVSLELGGKSAAIILPGADLEAAATYCVQGVMENTGQSCNARTRILIPEDCYEAAAEIAVRAAEALKVGDPADDDVDLGPVANKVQYDRVVSLIEQGVSEGAACLTGGPAKPVGLEKGFFVAPTIFGNVKPGMTIAREEVFGPVAVLMSYRTVAEAVDIANDSDYGLSGAVWGPTAAEATAVAEDIRTGMVHINGAGLDSAAPFGGYKMSGNGREWGRYGLAEFLELKSIYGAGG